MSINHLEIHDFKTYNRVQIIRFRLEKLIS